MTWGKIFTCRGYFPKPVRVDRYSLCTMQSWNIAMNALFLTFCSLGSLQNFFAHCLGRLLRIYFFTRFYLYMNLVTMGHFILCMNLWIMNIRFWFPKIHYNTTLQCIFKISKVFLLYIFPMRVICCAYKWTARLFSNRVIWNMTPSHNHEERNGNLFARLKNY